MLITTNMKSDLAFIAHNIPYSIQEGSTKENRHVVVLGHLKYNKVSVGATNPGFVALTVHRHGFKIEAPTQDRLQETKRFEVPTSTSEGPRPSQRSKTS